MGEVSFDEQVAQCLAERDALTQQLDEVQQRLEALAAAKVFELMRDGAWTTMANGTIEPLDEVAGRAVVDICEEVLRLGAHGGFAIHDGAVCVYGSVDDGRLGLSISVGRGTEYEETLEVMKSLKLNVDIVPLMYAQLDAQVGKLIKRRQAVAVELEKLSQARDKLWAVGPAGAGTSEGSANPFEPRFHFVASSDGDSGGERE